MGIFLVVLVLGLLVAMGLYAKKQHTPTVSIKPVTAKEVESQITDAVTSVVVPVEPVAEVMEEAPKKRGRKPRITAAKKVVKGKKQVAPKTTTRGRKKKS